MPDVASLKTISTFVPTSLQTQVSALNEPQAKNRVAQAQINEDQKLWDAANGFEALFLQEFLKSGRAFNLGEDLLGSSGVTSMQSLLDMEYAQLGGGDRGLGIARAVYEQFASQVADPLEGPSHATNE